MVRYGALDVSWEDGAMHESQERRMHRSYTKTTSSSVGSRIVLNGAASPFNNDHIACMRAIVITATSSFQFHTEGCFIDTNRALVLLTALSWPTPCCNAVE